MKIFAIQGIKDFVILTGYRGQLISDYFMNFQNLNTDFEVNLGSGSVRYLRENRNDWNVTVIDTGIASMTGGRLLRAKKFLENEKNFFFTYGDGLANVNLNSLLNIHCSLQTIATVTAVKPPSRFGKIRFSNSLATDFSEKPINNEDRINGGFFVLRPEIFNFISGDLSVFEEDALPHLTKLRQLAVFPHDGYWQCMDTMRDLEQIRVDASLSPVPWLNVDGKK
jgi:glucose-1-phosphate cytidylyltransferase